jgi:hypothetical protein
MVLLALGTGAQEKDAGLTGWFSDEGCATGRVKSGLISPTNPECARKCIDSGKAVVFISEQEKALFKVKDYHAAKDDLGYHIEISGTLDKASGTITVKSVKRLGDYEGPSCARPSAKKKQ